MKDKYDTNTPIMLVQRYERVKHERSHSDWEKSADDIERYVRPISGSFFQDYMNEGQNNWSREEIYNSTAVIASDSLAATIQGYLVNPSDKWFESKYRVEHLNRDDKAKEYLEQSDDAVYQALTQSNFDIKAAEFFLDHVTYGTAVVTEEIENEIEWSGLDFSTLPMRDVFFETDEKGFIVYLYRRFKWSAVQIYAKFGEEGTPERIAADAITGNNVSERHEVVFVIYPRIGKKDDEERKPAKERPWGYCYIMVEGRIKLGEEGGYHEMPAFLAHWKSVSTSKWGKSPAHDVLADIRNVNYWCKLHREAASKNVDPPMLVQDRGLLTNLDLRPGGLSVVRKIEDVSPLLSGSDFTVSYQEIKEMEENINQAFMQDRMALKESPAMTATEVNARREFMMRSITQPLAILQRNFLDPLIRRTYRILYRAGRLPPPPQIVLDEGSETDIHYTGPLPRQQKTQVVQAEMTFMQFINELRQVDPSVADVIDTDNMLRNIATNLGVPALDLRSQEEINDVRSKRIEAQQRQQKMLELQQAGQAMQSMAAGSASINQEPDTVQAIEELKR